MDYKFDEFSVNNCAEVLMRINPAVKLGFPTVAAFADWIVFHTECTLKEPGYWSTYGVMVSSCWTNDTLPDTLYCVASLNVYGVFEYLKKNHVAVV